MYKNGARTVYCGAKKSNKHMYKMELVVGDAEKVVEKMDTEGKDMEKKEIKAL